MDDRVEIESTGSGHAEPLPQTIVASGETTVLCLLGSAAFTVGGALMAHGATVQTRINGWFVLLFFGLCTAVAGVLLLRPQRLLLEPAGFTVLGGLVRRPRRVGWREIEGFFVCALPAGGEVVGYNWIASTEGSRMRRTIAGADAALPKGWPLPPPELAEKLNLYRAWALSSA